MLVGSTGSGIIDLTDVVGPFQFHGYVFVANVICLDTFNNRKSGKVLKKHNRSMGSQGNWMTDNGRDNQ